MGTAGEEGVQAEGTASEWPDTKAEGRLGLQGGQGQGREGHPPCTSALGRGTPARPSHTASGSASCSPCGRRLHGWGKKNTSAALPEEGRSGGGVSHLAGSGFSPAKCLQSGGHLHQGVLSPSPQSPQYRKTRTSNEQPVFCSDSDP